MRALQLHLFGYEFPSTIMLLVPDKLYLVASEKKGASPPASLHLRALQCVARSRCDTRPRDRSALHLAVHATTTGHLSHSPIDCARLQARSSST